MKRLLKISPLLLVASLSACTTYRNVNGVQPFLFGTFVSYEMKIENGFGGEKTINDLINILKKFDELSDFKQREETNVFTLNNTNEKVEISEEFYYLLEKANNLKETLRYFNPLIGSLSKKWKESLNLDEDPDKKAAVLDDEIIQEELAKIKSTTLTIEKDEETNKYYAQRVGEALLDFGAIAKGYVLDRCQLYLNNHIGDTEEYLINAGNSSVLLGKNLERKNGQYVIEIPDQNPIVKLEVSNAFISTSGVSRQSVVIDNKTYSHIINAETGSAISNYDLVSVIASNTYGNGALGDALSTSLMMSTREEIKQAEEQFGVSVIAIKDGNIFYKSDDITLLQ